jgi:protein translocase SecG subunit
MLNFLIGLLTVLMLLSCVLLTLLVLVQLPKKEAGAGMAFGAGTADALLGAGSGNALTKITKYTAAAFFVLCVALWLTYNHKNQSNVSEINRALEQVDKAPKPVVPTPKQPTAPQAGSLFGGAAATNMPAVQGTNVVPGSKP